DQLPRGRLYRAFGILLGLAFTLLIASRLGRPIPVVMAAPQLGGTELQQLSTAAAALDTALGKGGSGVTFEAVQRNTLHTKPGGPQIALSDPTDRTKIVAVVDDYYVNAVVTRGAITPNAFWMYMRRGPGEGQAADFDRSDPMYSVISVMASCGATTAM